MLTCHQLKLVIFFFIYQVNVDVPSCTRYIAILQSTITWLNSNCFYHVHVNSSNPAYR